MKNILVTGGGGFVGANLVRRLIEKKYSVHVITSPNSSSWRLKEIKKNIHIYDCGLKNGKLLKKIVKKISPYAVYHLATYGAYPTQQNNDLMISTNIQGTYNLLESLKEINYTQLIITGSSSEYGKKIKPMKEADNLEPNNFYGATKASATYLAQVFAKTNKKPLIIFRLFNVYGYYEEKGRLVRSIIESALQEKPIELATGKEARDLIFCEDVVDAFLFALNKKQFFGEVFNVGTGKQTTIFELAKIVKKLTRSKSKIQLGVYPGRPWDTKTWKADTYKTKKLLGWKNSNNLTTGLIKTIEWYKKYGSKNN